MLDWYAERLSDEIIPGMVAKGRLRDADKHSRLVALDALHYRVQRMSLHERLSYIRRVTGGLGDREDEPLDVVRMGLAGSVIAWPEAVRRGSRVLEIGTGLGRTRYAVYVTVEVGEYVSIDVDPVILAIALYDNPVPSYQEALWARTRIVLGDATRILRLLPSQSFDHVIHDGGPNPRRNPRLYSQSILRELWRVVKPGGTVSVFAGADRRWRSRIYEQLKRLGFEVVETLHLPGSKAAVIHARRPRRAPCHVHDAGDESLGD